MSEFVRNYIKDSIDIKRNILENEKLIAQIEDVSSIIVKAFKTGNKIILCGNGGSAADAQHIAAEFVGRFKTERKALPAIALTTDTSIITAISNDYGYDTVFSRQIQAIGKSGDVLIGIASTGIHSNGYSLVRQVFSMKRETLDTYYDSLGSTLGEALLVPTRIYVGALKSIREAGVKVKACSHITGGGFYENVPRMLKDGTRAVIRKDSYPVPPIFRMLSVDGDIEEQMMYNTFNMGLGMIVAVDEADADRAMDAIRAAGDTPYAAGRIEAGDKGVELC